MFHPPSRCWVLRMWRTAFRWRSGSGCPKTCRNITYSAVIVILDCSSPTQHPSGVCVVKKYRRARSIASVTRRIHSGLSDDGSWTGESDSAVMGDLLKAVGRGTKSFLIDLTNANG